MRRNWRPTTRLDSASTKRLVSRFALVTWFTVAGFLFPGLAWAQTGEASTTRASKDDALRSIPWNKLNQPTQEKLSEVVSRPSIFRRLPVKVIDCEPEMFIFLVRYPEVVVNIWEIMGVSNVNIRRTGDYTFTAADTGGTNCNVELVYGSPNMHILYADAVYDGNLLTGKVRGKCVLVLRSEYSQADGRTVVTSRMDMFVKVDSVGADLIARTLQPMIGKSADVNFTETADFISRVSVASQSNQNGVSQLASQLENCTPAVKNKFAEVSVAVHNRHVQATAERSQQLPYPQPQPTDTSQRQQPYPYHVNGQGGGYRQ
jgi:hypothetical protein